ncbi:Hypothetical predicted protein [Marmota monax]|uniref:Uncharacterized protein n=1 Tax=Marmota monax TaxID=9995 RepID=A0A5E4A4T6_MARMO|nr:hypothetical protein GHT09_006430 [Marmota monax]VTJ52049.1 Hypothetical predicted protein [Marmota monax]
MRNKAEGQVRAPLAAGRLGSSSPKLLEERSWVSPGMPHPAAGCAATGPREKLGGPGRPRGRVAAVVQRL